ncbi:MAG: hypothetical protein ACREJV_01200 [Candidatus Rokuibacteriota bacterium]
MDQRPQRKLDHWFVTAVLVLMVVGASGCAAMHQPMPDIKGRLAISVSSELPNGHEIAAGVHRLPDTAVYVSGYFADAMQTGQFFGALGMIAAEASARSRAEKKTAHVTALRLDMAAAARRILSDQLARGDVNRFASSGPADATVEVVPYLVVASTGNDQMRPWVFVKTSLKDNGGAEKWKMRYIVSLGEPRSLEGPNGWVAGDGSSLRSAVNQALRTAIDLLMRDASGQLQRHTGRDVKVKAQWAWSKEMVEYAAEVLDETAERMTIATKTMRGISDGVIVIDKTSIRLAADAK